MAPLGHDPARPAQASSISAASDHHNHTPKLKLKMKMKMSDSVPIPEPKKLKLLSGSPSRKPQLTTLMISSSSSSPDEPSSGRELTLFNPPAPVTASSIASGTPARTFLCNFCRMEFKTSQALGGHQKAHRQERAVVYRRQHLEALASLAPHYSYNHGPHSQSFLGVCPGSLIHKPSCAFSTCLALSGFPSSPSSLSTPSTTLSLFGCVPLKPVPNSGLFGAGSSSSNPLRAKTNTNMINNNTNRLGFLNVNGVFISEIVPSITPKHPGRAANPTGGEKSMAEKRNSDDLEEDHKLNLHLKL